MAVKNELNIEPNGAIQYKLLGAISCIHSMLKALTLDVEKIKNDISALILSDRAGIHSDPLNGENVVALVLNEAHKNTVTPSSAAPLDNAIKEKKIRKSKKDKENIKKEEVAAPNLNESTVEIYNKAMDSILIAGAKDGTVLARFSNSLEKYAKNDITTLPPDKLDKFIAYCITGTR